jgi:diaminopimelate decarboxylase
MKMGGGAKQFGVDAEDRAALLARWRANWVWTSRLPHLQRLAEPEGRGASSRRRAQTFALAMRLAAHAPRAAAHLNIGGGFGIPYFPGEQRSTWPRSAPPWAPCCRA